MTITSGVARRSVGVVAEIASVFGIPVLDGRLTLSESEPKTTVSVPETAVHTAMACLGLVPVSANRYGAPTVNMEFVKVVPVWVGSWLAKGALENQIGDEAEQLARALERADSNPVYEHSPGQGQKPHN